MKKIFTAPSVNFMQVEMEDNILGASEVTNENAKSTFEPEGTGNGNGLARQNNSTTNGSNPINVEALDF